MEPLGTRAPTVERREPTLAETAARDTGAALWASQLLGALLPEARSIGLVAAESRSSSTVAPAPPLAPTDEAPSAGPAASQPSDTGGVKPLGPERLTMDVDTPELGSLRVTIERDGGGISLLIAGSASAKAALLADRQALVDALTQGSGPVTSVRILRRDEVGTVLAEGGSSRKEKSADPKPTPFSPNSKTPARRRLNLIG